MGAGKSVIKAVNQAPWHKTSQGSHLLGIPAAKTNDNEISPIMGCLELRSAEMLPKKGRTPRISGSQPSKAVLSAPVSFGLLFDKAGSQPPVA